MRGRGVILLSPEYQPPARRAYASESGMDDLFFNRMLNEWLKYR
jgi:hypothetical protein